MLKLNLTDNWLGREGGQRICDMLTENCYIADLVRPVIKAKVHSHQTNVKKKTKAKAKFYLILVFMQYQQHS